MTPALRDLVPADLPAVLSIHNAEVREGTALWHTTETTLAERAAFFAGRQAAGFPALVAETGGRLAGYASFGPFRPFDGYRHTVEHSLYVAPDLRGCGIGALLLARLLAEAQTRDMHVMIGGIEAGNSASLALHRRAGFREAGRLAEVGRKFGRWLDLVFVEKRL